MTITRAHLTTTIHNPLDLTKVKSAGLVESVFEIMRNRLENGEEILISRFGKFCINAEELLSMSMLMITTVTSTATLLPGKEKLTSAA